MAMNMRPATSGYGQRAGAVRLVYEDFTPLIESREDQEANTVDIHLPGFLKEQLRIVAQTSRGVLRVRGERMIAGNRLSRFVEEIPVPEDCDIAEIRAKLEGGILRINMPKKIPAVAPLPPPPPSSSDEPATPKKSPPPALRPAPPLPTQPAAPRATAFPPPQPAAPRPTALPPPQPAAPPPTVLSPPQPAAPRPRALPPTQPVSPRPTVLPPPQPVALRPPAPPRLTPSIQPKQRDDEPISSPQSPSLMPSRPAPLPPPPQKPEDKQTPVPPRPAPLPPARQPEAAGITHSIQKPREDDEPTSKPTQTPPPAVAKSTPTTLQTLPQPESKPPIQPIATGKRRVEGKTPAPSVTAATHQASATAGADGEVCGAKERLEEDEKYRKATKRVYGRRMEEDRQLLVNIGAAVLVVAALGAWISYTLGSSAKPGN